MSQTVPRQVASNTLPADEAAAFETLAQGVHPTSAADNRATSELATQAFAQVSLLALWND